MVEYTDEYRKQQAKHGKKGKKVGKGHFHKLKEEGKDDEIRKLARKGRASPPKI